MYRQISPSATLLLNEQSEAISLGGKEVFRFGFGQSPFPICDTLDKALKQNAYRKEYTQVQGLKLLREKVAQFHQTFEHRSVTAEQVFIAPGSKILLYSIMCAFTDAIIFIPSPAWVSYAPQAELLGHSTCAMMTSFAKRYRLTPDMLENCLANAPNQTSVKIVIINSPGNPDGLSYTDAELQALTNVLRKYSAWVISDEIYGPLHFEGQHVSIAKYYPEATFVTSGLSKWAGAGGWRLGVGILPQNHSPELKASILGIASETYSCAPAPIQYAAIAAYSPNPAMKTYVANERTILKAIGQRIYKEVIDIGLRAHKPEGGFYILVDFSTYSAAFANKGITKDLALCSDILAKTGVALLPGSAFGLPPEDLTARLAFVDFDGNAALKEIAQKSWSKELTEKYCQKMLRGLNILAHFLQSLGE